MVYLEENITELNITYFWYAMIMEKTEQMSEEKEKAKILGLHQLQPFANPAQEKYIYETYLTAYELHSTTSLHKCFTCLLQLWRNEPQLHSILHSIK